MEGTESPFTVWTDHKNLAYIQGAKHLNSRQARWALFFGRFKFNLMYRPGSKNVKPDALPRQFHDNSDNPSVPDTILPASCLIGSLTWEIEYLVRTALLTNPDPGGGGPQGCLFVPVFCPSPGLLVGSHIQVCLPPWIDSLKRYILWLFLNFLLLLEPLNY